MKESRSGQLTQLLNNWTVIVLRLLVLHKMVVSAFQILWVVQVFYVRLGAILTLFMGFLFFYWDSSARHPLNTS